MKAAAEETNETMYRAEELGGLDLTWHDARNLPGVQQGIYHTNWNLSFYDIISYLLERYGDNPQFHERMKECSKVGDDGEPQYIGCDAGLTGNNGKPYVAGSAAIGWLNVRPPGETFEVPFKYGTMVFPANFGKGWSRVTVNQAETLALAMALATVRQGWSGILVSDSKIALGVVKDPNMPRDWLRREDIMLVDYLANRVSCTYSFVPGHTVDARSGVYLRNTDPRLHINYLVDGHARTTIKAYMKQVNHGIYFHPDGTLKRNWYWSPEGLNGIGGFDPNSTADDSDEEDATGGTGEGG